MNLPSIEALEAVHLFPGRYIFKAFGTNAPGFAEALESLAKNVLGHPCDIQTQVRLGAKGVNACVTLDILVASASQVRDIYVELSQFNGLKLLL